MCPVPVPRPRSFCRQADAPKPPPPPSHAGDLLLRFAEVDDALVRGSQWLRPFTACLADYGLVQFAITNLGLITVVGWCRLNLGWKPC